MKRFIYSFILCLTLSGVGHAQDAQKILAVQQSQISQLLKKIEGLQKQLTCVKQNSGTTSSLSCRVVAQAGRVAGCAAGETLTGGGAGNNWGVAVIDSMPNPDGRSWTTSSSDWNTVAQTAKPTSTYAVCCRVVASSIENLCPGS